MSNKKQRVILKFRDDNFTEQLKKLLLNTGRVKVTNLGVFEIRSIPARDSYDVNTHQKIVIPKHNKLGFKPTKLLKQSIQKYEDQE